MDPLIVAGKKVVPLLLKEIQDKNMLQRRYGIVALGHLGDLSAIPVLERILKDPSEIDYFRCDALEAIALLDSDEAHVLAKEQASSSVDCINQLAEALVNGKLPVRRTYLQALVGWHE
jgi:HEAT repeat protein